MDDKEKEKFGVIIDKNDQDTENQPKVDESAEGKNIYIRECNFLSRKFNF